MNIRDAKYAIDPPGLRGIPPGVLGRSPEFVYNPRSILAGRNGAGGRIPEE